MTVKSLFLPATCFSQWVTRRRTENKSDAPSFSPWRHEMSYNFDSFEKLQKFHRSEFRYFQIFSNAKTTIVERIFLYRMGTLLYVCSFTFLYALFIRSRKIITIQLLGDFQFVRQRQMAQGFAGFVIVHLRNPQKPAASSLCWWINEKKNLSSNSVRITKHGSTLIASSPRIANITKYFRAPDLKKI